MREFLDLLTEDRDVTSAIMGELSSAGWTTPAECNDGYCGHFAENVVRELGRGKVLSTDVVKFPHRGGRHEWVFVDGLHYDSETPFGVKNPHDLGYFCRHEKRPMPPHLWEPDEDEWDSDEELTEAISGDQIDLDHAYEVFRRSYENETGTAWSKDKFLGRAHDWTFYGDENGYIAVRRQRSGMLKLVGVAGNPASIVRGLGELQQEALPIWGAVSAPLARMAQKRGMIVPHLYPGGAYLIRALVAMIPASVMGGYKPEVGKDGGLVIHYSDVGTTTKFLIGNKLYFQTVVRWPEIADRLRAIPGATMLLRLMGVSPKS